MGRHTNITDYEVNSTADFFRFSAEAIGNDIGSYDMFGGIIVVIVFSTAFLTTLKWGGVKAFAFASFFAALTSIILFLLNIVSEAVMVVPGLLVIASIIILYSTQGE